jgi:hypothetical protein
MNASLNEVCAYGTLPIDEEKKQKSKEYNQVYYEKNRKNILKQKKEQREGKINEEAQNELKAWVIAFWKKKRPFDPFSE